MGTLVGYARCSTDRQDLTAQRQQLGQLGVMPDRIYLDHGLTGRSRDDSGTLSPSNSASICASRPPCLLAMPGILSA